MQTLNPIWVVICTFSPKHRSCKVFSATLIQIPVTRNQMALLDNRRNFMNSNICSLGNNLLNKHIDWFYTF